MARYQAKPREDGRGPYRWSHVVKTPEGFACGNIYHQVGTDLSTEDICELRNVCDRAGYDLRRIA